MTSAYRGESSGAGLTAKADLLNGQRTNPSEVESLIQNPTTMTLLCLHTFPDDFAAGIPLVEGLQFEMLKKDL